MENATDLIRSYQALLTNSVVHYFRWHIQRHSQTHAMLHILNELYTVDLSSQNNEVQCVAQQAWNTMASVSMESAVSISNEATTRVRTSLGSFRERVEGKLARENVIKVGSLTAAAPGDEEFWEIDDPTLVDINALLDSMPWDYGLDPSINMDFPML